MFFAKLQEYAEKVVRMNKPPYDDSFGFSIRGGKEHDSPIYVEYVTTGQLQLPFFWVGPSLKHKLSWVAHCGEAVTVPGKAKGLL